MKNVLNRQLAIFLLIPLLINGCAQNQTTSKLYPMWGKSVALKSSNNQHRHFQILAPEQINSTQACILMVHGMNEHIGRYTKIAHYFSDDYIIAGIDLTAHGLSNSYFAKAQEELKKQASTYDVSDAFLEQSQFSDLQPMRNDLEQGLLYLIHRCDQLSDNKTLPIFILSHSLGSLVSASYLLNLENNQLKQRIAGIIFTGPAFSVTQVPGWRGWMQNPFINFSYHTHHHFLNPQDEFLPLMLFNQLLAFITVPIQDGMIELVSLLGLRQIFSPTTPPWVEKYLSNWEEEKIRHKADPYIIRRSILRYVLAVEKEVIKFRQSMSQFNLPYLLIYSEHDPITPAWGSIDFTAATLQNHPNNEAMMLKGASHHEQLFSEPELQHKVFNKISSWITSRIMEKETGR